MFNSSSYNLSNPGLTEDIGTNNLNRMLPMPPFTFAGGTFYPGISGTMNGTRIKGNLDNDLYQPTRKERDKSIIKKVLAGTGLLAAGILCFKGGKKIVQFIKNLFQKTK